MTSAEHAEDDEAAHHSGDRNVNEPFYNKGATSSRADDKDTGDDEDSDSDNGEFITIKVTNEEGKTEAEEIDHIKEHKDHKDHKEHKSRFELSERF